MAHIFDFLTRHGPTVLFAAVFIEQMGIPLPASPWLLAAGALAASGKMHWYSSLLAAAIGSSLADSIWFYLGRHGGQRVMNFLCRISLEPDSCVRRTQNLYTKYGMPGLVLAKFVPGLNTLAPPLAGSSGARFPQFLLFDGIGSLIYTGCFILIGTVFSRQLDQVIAALGSLGAGAIAVVVGLIAIYIGYKFYQRQHLLKELRTARITADELYHKLETGETPIILDLRSKAEVTRDPALIRGARHITMDELKTWEKDIPRDREIVLYCSCPNEVSSARMALFLQKNGLTRVRPLLGGIDAWRERNYPIEILATAAVVQTAATASSKNET
jgi:membrane protein DedA with SNARE-associated domain/rhodanese-related sulfurtransferase